MEDLPGSSLLTTVVNKTLKILPRGVNLCQRNAASMIALESVEWFDLQHKFLFWTRPKHSLISYPDLTLFGRGRSGYEINVTLSCSCPVMQATWKSFQFNRK